MDQFVDDFVTSNFTHLQEELREGKNIDPQILLFGREAGMPAIMPLIGVESFFESKEKKRLIPSLVKSVWKRITVNKPLLKLVAVFLVTDAWCEVVPIDVWEKMGRKREKPFVATAGTAEALLIQVSLIDREIFYQWPYVKDVGGEIVFADKPIKRESKKGDPKGLAQGLWPLS